MTRLEWQKAKRRDRQRVARLRVSAKKARAKQRQNDTLRQLAIQAFVDKHAIECFACGTIAARWAKNGINKRGPWVICVPCVARNRSKKRQTEAPALERERRDLIAENEALHKRQREIDARRRARLDGTVHRRQRDSGLLP